jgi:hypothetical protein
LHSGINSTQSTFFPRLVGDGRTGPSLSREEEESFYELGLRPSIARLLPDSVSDWPVTYNSARKCSGDIYLQKKIVDSWVLRLLPDSIRSELAKNGVRWAEDLFFSHNIRGTEHGTRHRCNVKSAQAALIDYLLDARIPLEATYEGIWWIDVGLEITSDDDACLQWRTSSHLQVVKEVLQIPERQAKRVTSFGSSTYARDMVSHLTAVSGCRIEPGVEAQGPFQAAYIEMYTTDKGKHHRKAMTIKTAMSRTQPPSFIEWLVNLYTKNVDDDSSKARIKVRVPLDLARTALLGLDIGTVRGGLLSFTRSEWW